MTSEPQRPDPRELPEARVQFSLHSAFVVMTLAAVGCALVLRIPDIVAIPVVLFLTVALMPVMITVMIYGSSYQRTFAIGAIFPPGLLLLTVLPITQLFADFWPDWARGPDSVRFRVTIGGFWIASVAMGFLCVATRRLVEKRPGKQATPAGTPFARRWNAET